MSFKTKSKKPLRFDVDSELHREFLKLKFMTGLSLQILYPKALKHGLKALKELCENNELLN